MAGRGVVIVVKLGGSLMRGEHLAAWMDTLADLPEPVVVVPGGGAFADAVRDIQRADDFGGRLSDTLAHNMAVLAMAQYAWLLKAFRDDFVLEENWASLAEAGSRGVQRQLWLPAPGGLPPGIEPHWGSTSDSIAAALAVALESVALLLVKSAPIPTGPQRLADLAAAGIVDSEFPGWFQRLEQPVFAISAGDVVRREGLARGLETAASRIVA